MDTQIQSNNKMEQRSLGRKVTVGAKNIGDREPIHTSSLSSLYLSMLLAPVSLTLTALNRVKECLYLGIDVEEEHGCKQMQWEKHKLHEIHICVLKLGQSSEDDVLCSCLRRSQHNKNIRARDIQSLSARSLSDTDANYIN